MLPCRLKRLKGKMVLIEAIANVRENFSKHAMCAKTLEVYNEVLHLKAAS